MFTEYLEKNCINTRNHKQIRGNSLTEKINEKAHNNHHNSMLLYVFVSVLLFQNASNEYKYSIHTITLVYYTAVVVNFPFFVVAIIFVLSL